MSLRSSIVQRVFKLALISFDYCNINRNLSSTCSINFLACERLICIRIICINISTFPKLIGNKNFNSSNCSIKSLKT